MSSSERRIDTRVSVRVPLRFRALDNPGSTEQMAQSENISQRGLYFLTNVPLKIGTPVEVSLRMPQEVAGRLASDVKCMVHVVHVKQSSAPGGMSGIGLHIERYEAKASVRERVFRGYRATNNVQYILILRGAGVPTVFLHPAKVGKTRRRGVGAT